MPKVTGLERSRVEAQVQTPYVNSYALRPQCRHLYKFKRSLDQAPRLSSLPPGIKSQLCHLLAV